MYKFFASFLLRKTLFSFEQDDSWIGRPREGTFILVKLFVLGGPGSGKSTVARSIELQARDYQWLTRRINDYEILRKMFLEDAEKSDEERWFAASEHDGFNVLNFAAFDVALQRLELKATEILVQNELLASRPLFALIEFARNDYQRAFQHFSREFLQDAYFLYLDTDIKICRQRIQERISKPLEDQTEDDYYVSDDIFKRYYNHEQKPSLIETLANSGIAAQRVLEVDNNQMLETVSPEIKAFVDSIFTQCSEDEEVSAENFLR